MKTNHLYYLFLLLCIVTIASVAWLHRTSDEKSKGVTKNKKPNILVIVSDQQHFGAFGKIDDFFSTPNMNHLASKSVMFSNALVTSPQCSPSRSSIYTGLYPHKTGVMGNTGSIDHLGNVIKGLSGKYKTIGEYLRPAGYFTGYVGKWHLGRVASHANGYDVGKFDTVVGGDYTTDKQKTIYAVSFLDKWKKEKEKPFALFLNYTDPHHIYDFSKQKKWNDPSLLGNAPLPENYFIENLSEKPLSQHIYRSQDMSPVFQQKSDLIWRKYREFYRDRVALFDQELGYILNRVRELDLWEDTIIMVTSDHGDLDTQHRLTYKGPFGYEPLIRVPLIVHIPKKYGGIASTAIDDMTVNVDLLPTLLDFAEVTYPALDGISLKPLLTGKKNQAKYQYYVGQYYNKQKWVHPIRIIRDSEHKLIDHLTGTDELYDLVVDPEETHNKIKDPSYASVKIRLIENLNHWIEKQGDPFLELNSTHPPRK